MTDFRTIQKVKKLQNHQITLQLKMSPGLSTRNTALYACLPVPMAGKYPR